MTQRSSITIDIIVAYHSYECEKWLIPLITTMKQHKHLCLQKVYIYGKKQQHSPLHTSYCEVVIDTLPNVGGCDHTYLSHIVRHYDTLPDVVICLKDTIDIHISNTQNRQKGDTNLSRLKHLLNTLNTPSIVNITAPIFSIYNIGTTTVKDIYGFQLDNWVRQSSPCTTFTIATHRPFSKWFEHICCAEGATANDANDANDANEGSATESIDGDRRLRVILGGMFAITSRRLTRIPKSTYQNILDSLESHGNNSEVEHYVERCYACLFQMLPPLYFTNKIVVISAHIGGSNNTHNVTHISEIPQMFQSADYSDQMLRSTAWCPHIMYTDNKELYNRSKALGWLSVHVDTKHLQTLRDTNMFAKRYKMQPHVLNEIREHNPEHIVWMDSTRCLSHRENILANIDGFRSKQVSVIMMQNFCGGGNDGNVMDEIRESFKQPRYQTQLSQYRILCNHYNRLRIPSVDKDGVFFWCTNIIYNIRHPQYKPITNLWYTLTRKSGIYQDQILMHYVHQMYKTSFAVSPLMLFHNTHNLYEKNQFSRRENTALFL